MEEKSYLLVSRCLPVNRSQVCQVVNIFVVVFVLIYIEIEK